MNERLDWCCSFDGRNTDRHSKEFKNLFKAGPISYLFVQKRHLFRVDASFQVETIYFRKNVNQNLETYLMDRRHKRQRQDFVGRGLHHVLNMAQLLQYKNNNQTSRGVYVYQSCCAHYRYHRRIGCLWSRYAQLYVQFE